MKVSKSSISGNGSTFSLSHQDIQNIAEAIGKILIKELSSKLSEPRKGLALNSQPGVQMDESLVDVGVSTAGIQNASEGSIGKEIVTEDNISTSMDKLKSLKKSKQ